MSKQEKLKDFDPNSAASGKGNLPAGRHGIFGLPFSVEEAQVVLIPVPWDVTVSYKEGTSKGPKSIFDASFQVDLFDPSVKDSWKTGIAMAEISKALLTKNSLLRKKASAYIKNIEKGISMEAAKMKKIRKEVNNECLWLKSYVKESAGQYLKENRLVGLVGGDHSTPLGFIEALAEDHEFGILQIDAHCDLRKAYEGFEYSHASIMYNALKIPQVKKLVQVGIRDWCEEENRYILESNGRVNTFFDHSIKRKLYEGITWKEICSDIVSGLPEKVYLSFDIDGLDPKLCPHTGTPVPGGLEFEQAIYLITQIARSNKKIIGFDLNEVAPGKDEWDGNVGARILYKMCNIAAVSNGLASWSE